MNSEHISRYNNTNIEMNKLQSAAHDNNNILRNLKSSQRVIVIDDVKHDRHWSYIEGELCFYNALWTLPEDRFNETFMKTITDNNVCWRVIYFEGDNEEDRIIANERYRKMRSALDTMIAKNSFVKSRIEIRKSNQGRLPQITFFLFYDGKENVVRFYIDKLLSNDIPRIAFDVYDPTVFGLLQSEFDSQWSDSKKQDVPPIGNIC